MDTLDISCTPCLDDDHAETLLPRLWERVLAAYGVTDWEEIDDASCYIIEKGAPSEVYAHLGELLAAVNGEIARADWEA